MAAEKIQLLHPAGKKAPAISREIFVLFENAIINILQKNQPMAFSALAKEVENHLCMNGKGFKGSIPWYSVCVKQHLEATGVIIAKTEGGTKMHYLK